MHKEILRCTMKFNIALFSCLILAGCGTIYDNRALDVEENTSSTAAQSYDWQDTYMTKAYETAATRVANKMLDDTSDLYETKDHPKLYIKQVIKKSPNLPDGFHTARQALREITGKSGTFVLVNNIEEADYILEPTVSEFNAAGLPAIIFRIDLNDKNDQPFRAWNVVIRQLSEDKSWW